MRHFKDTAGVVWGFDADQHQLAAAASAAGWQELDIWPIPPTPEEIAAAENAAMVAELAALDLASIRALREYVASRPDAPQLIKDREAAAAAARARLK